MVLHAAVITEYVVERPQLTSNPIVRGIFDEFISEVSSWNFPRTGNALENVVKQTF